jgi:alkylation response protein AidB-like acyl-CoA dehydrogenase
MERCLEESVSYAKQRVTMGKPIAEHQMIQAYLAEMATEIFASRAMTRQVAWMSDQGENVIKEAAMAKLYASQSAEFVASKAVEIYGGNGFTKEYPVEKYFRDQKVGQIYEGTTNMQLAVIAKQILGRLS